MEVYLCEKPSQAEDLAQALGSFTRSNGLFRISHDIIVTWAIGHLFEMCKPEEYDVRYKRWSINDLPIKPGGWKKKVKQSTKDQFRVVQDLLKQASIIYIADRKSVV